MTQEDKKLLLKDLLARLPYGVKCNALLKQIDGSLKSTFGTFKGYNNGYATIGQNLVDIETVRPYLRPMSSMNGEEKNEFRRVSNCKVYKDDFYNEYDEYSENFTYIDKDTEIDTFDWLNVHHFDYRGLISKGLATEVTEENNPYKE